MTYTYFRGKLASTMGRVCGNKEFLIITRYGKQAVVMLSLEEYKAFKEMACLLLIMAKAKRLLSVAGNFPRTQSVTPVGGKWGKFRNLSPLSQTPIVLSSLVLYKIQAICLWLAVDKVLGILIMRPSLGG